MWRSTGANRDNDRSRSKMDCGGGIHRRYEGGLGPECLAECRNDVIRVFSTRVCERPRSGCLSEDLPGVPDEPSHCALARPGLRQQPGSIPDPEHRVPKHATEFGRTEQSVPDQEFGTFHDGVGVRCLDVISQRCESSSTEVPSSAAARTSSTTRPHPALKVRESTMRTSASARFALVAAASRAELR